MGRWLKDVLGRWYSAVIRTRAARQTISDQDNMLSYNSRTYMNNLATLENGGVI